MKEWNDISTELALFSEEDWGFGVTHEELWD